MVFYKYQGAGNDFLIADNRKGKIFLTPQYIQRICDRRFGIGADGVMLLQASNSPQCLFDMAYYNSDGSSGMMCGNGGRCIVAFAKHCGLVGKEPFCFSAPDGIHTAQILPGKGSSKEITVRLGMRDVDEIVPYHTDVLSGVFLDTGTRHFVKSVERLSEYPVFEEGQRLRHRPELGPIGANINFIEPVDGVLHVRTFEKGVEDETLACGTGIVASAIAFHHAQVADSPETPVSQPIRALGGALQVDFILTPTGAHSVFLTGPAAYVAKVIIPV